MSAVPSGAPTSSCRGAPSRSSRHAPNRASWTTWARPATASRFRRCGRRLPSCSPRSTKFRRRCAAPFRTSTTSTSSNGSSGWARSCARLSHASPPSRTTSSSDESPTRLVVVRPPPRPLHALLYGDVGALQLYGMRGFLILYMVKALGFTDVHAGSVYGNYVGSVWLAAIFGGVIADRWLGHYRSVLIGGAIIALGHFTLAFHALSFFYAGLTLIVVGTGLLKPNVSTLVGSLYEQGDERRDAGFSIFYMGINLGAFLGPIIAGKLAESVDWHLGFACAGVGMTLGLVQYVLGRRRLEPAIARLAARPTPVTAAVNAPDAGYTPEDLRRMIAVVVFFAFASLFWGAYEQAGSTLALFADRYVHLKLLGIKLYASWFVSIQAAFVILLSPFFAWLWVKLGPRQPSSPAKFALAQGGVKISPLWLVAVYFLEELGELCLSPVGLSVVTKLAPKQVVGLMMGVFFLANALGNKLVGWSAGFISTTPLPTLFGVTASVTLGAAAVMFMLIKPVQRLMGGVR